MEKTICLYDSQPYEVAFEATVLSCESLQREQEMVYEVVLDRTMFFPEQGGQTPDKGTLGGAKILDVQIRDGVVTHTVDASLAVGKRVQGMVDWDYRFSNMQQHTGEHIFSGIVYETYGFHNVGFHLSDSVVTMDYDGVIPPEEISDIEMRANQVIADNLPVEVEFPTPEALKQLEYRSKKELEGPVRIVTVPGVDVCACCAPHVRRTGEIGLIKVMDAQHYKGGVRISILCGFRALEAFRQQERILAELTGLLSANPQQLPERVRQLKQTSHEQAYRLLQLQEPQLMERVKTADANMGHVFVFSDPVDANVMRRVVNELTVQHNGFCGVFAGNDADGYQFVIGSRKEDCQGMATLLRETCTAKCGGSTKMIQGTLPTTKECIKSTFKMNIYSYNLELLTNEILWL